MARKSGYISEDPQTPFTICLMCVSAKLEFDYSYPSASYFTLNPPLPPATDQAAR